MRVIDTPTWFGDGDHPLFGWLTRPEDGRVRAGVVLANSVGYEARAGRVALAALARALAEAGFACLRFDYRGTGDASGDFDTSLADRDWLEDIGTAVGYLREAGADAVTLIGMRLGAPLVSEAVQRGHADVANLVLWDPCATGRSGLRELGMLPALRREGPAEGGDESVETAEFLFSAPQAAALNSMKTSFPSSVKRCLVITRRARPLLKAFQGPVSEGSCDAITTDEQEALLEVLPFDLTIPRATIASMVEWVVAASPSSDVATSFTVVSDATWVDGGGSTPIRETARFVGEREVVVVTTEPVTAPSGPWVVMIANVHDDHIGPSRVWVEMSRQWARDGLRCARVDVAGLGESTRHLSRSEVEVFDARWMDDIRQIVAELSPEDPTNVVFVGFCLSAAIAMEMGLESHARGACVINPPMGRNFNHALFGFQASRSRVANALARTMKSIYTGHPLMIVIGWEVTRRVLSLGRLPDVLDRMDRDGCKVLVLGSDQDLVPISTQSVLRRIEQHYRLTLMYPRDHVIARLDHAMTSAPGRANAVAALDAHVRANYVPHRRGPA